MQTKKIILKKVSVHNLKEVSLSLPKNALIVFTGVSGSGKSSLAFDTLFVEGQRRYIESLSTYARRGFGNLQKPDAEDIEGLSPTVAIEQKQGGHNPRSTVGTMTGLYDYLRVLFARLGTPHCPISHEVVTPSSRKQIIESILSKYSEKKIIILAPYAMGKKGEFKEEFSHLLKKGFTRVRIDQNFYHLDEDKISLDKEVAHDIQIVIDRITLSLENKGRLIEAIESGLDLGKGMISIYHQDSNEEDLFSEFAYSPKSGQYYKPLEPEDFSFNHPNGMCPECKGLGVIQEFDLSLVIDPSLSIKEGCCQIAGSYDTVKWGNIYDNLAKLYKFSVNTPWEKLSSEAKEVFLYGTESKWTKMSFKHPTTGATWTDYIQWKGVISEAKKRLHEAKSPLYRDHMKELMHEATCQTCKGARIKPYPMAATFRDKRIFEICEMMISEAVDFFSKLSLNPRETFIGEELVREVKTKLTFLQKVGLGYLTLSRTAPTLSGGETQRVRLAAGVGFGLVGTTYILDEPSIGLHPRDNIMLLETLHKLKAKGNTVIVVEHDEETIRSADYVVDIGPGAGVLGGEIVAEGNVNDLIKEEKSITGAYLSGRLAIPIPKKRRSENKGNLKIIGASHHNLKNIDVTIPLGRFVAFTGVSGSGKSSLVSDILYPALSNALHKSKLSVGTHKKIEGIEQIDKIIAIDQSPIGRTPRSNPATYIKVFDDIRDLFSSLPEAVAFGYKPGRFSFNVREGSCYYCLGMGMLRIDMDFMEDEWIECPHCNGKRFDQKTLDITYKGKNIHDVLEMSIQEAHTFFQDIPPIAKKLSILLQVGLDYVKLGQSATTLSGGEAQRIKLSKELAKQSTKNTLYLLDEPSTGLHFHDVKKLIDILQNLVDKGSSIVIIEHNMDVIKTADWIIDLGPEGGKQGGKVMGFGTPEKIAQSNTPTGQFLHLALQKKTMGSFPSYHEEKHPLQNALQVKNASQNNLKNVSLTLPRGGISVFTGPSGSGKTSLAFETIYAEGQRRYIDTLSTHARQFVTSLPKPKVEEIEGLSPAICIEQNRHTGNARSTLGTLTEIYDYLKILYARLGVPYCPETGYKIQSITPSYVIEKVFALEENTKLQILAPLTLRRGEEFTDIKNKWQKLGFLRIRLNGSYFELDEKIPYDKNLKNDLAIVIDRLTNKKETKKRLYDAIEIASNLSDQTVLIALANKDLFFNLAFAVPETGKSYPKITHHTFSFNADQGMCLDCLGIGVKWGANLENNPHLFKYTPLELISRLLKDFISKESLDLFKAFWKEEIPLKNLSKERLHLFFEGSETSFTYKKIEFTWLGLNKVLERMAKMGKNSIRDEIIPLLHESDCPSCKGTRLNPLARSVKIDGVTITELCNMPLNEAYQFISSLKGKHVLKDVLLSLTHKLNFLCHIGLDYLSLNRSAKTLSGGEIQRTRLARQLGSGLTGVLYVLDEPTIGLHPHNNQRLNEALKKLKNLGNTLILVEHDPMTIIEADQIYDFGPASGRNGGEITASGSPKELMKNENSLTGQYLSGAKKIPIPNKRREIKKTFFIEKATKHNIKNLDVEIPIGVLTCITGVSGSGKSTLISDILLPALIENTQAKKPKETLTTKEATFHRLDYFDGVISIDQEPIGRTIRSDVSTYVDLLTPLRSFFASLPESITKGLLPKHFSANHPSGMCKKCRGLGFQTVELQFMPPAKVPCDACNGHKLSPLSLSITYKGKNLGQLLQMSVREAKETLPPIPKVHRILDRLIAVGLDYVALSQETQTLSGGEGGRLRLSRELAKRTKEHTLYLFDEPTTGLHPDDIAKILPIFHALVDKGNTLIIIEHNLDILVNADYIIDIGPEAGEKGGQIVAKGTPEEIAKEKNSYTGKYIKKFFT